MNLIRQEKLNTKLNQYRFRMHDIGLVKVKVYDTFKDEKYMCCMEVFRGDTDIKNRLMKHEDTLDGKFLKEAERRLDGNLSSVF